MFNSKFNNFLVSKNKKNYLIDKNTIYILLNDFRKQLFNYQSFQYN